MKCEVLVDWLTFSVKASDPWQVILDYLAMDPDLFQDVGYPLLGYNKVLEFLNIKVCYDPRENEYFQGMGVCVSMSGSGCRAFEKMSDLAGGDAISVFPALFRKLAGDKSCNVSRLDIACDDRHEALDMEKIIQKVQANEVNSRMSRRQVVVSYDGSERNGSTVYIGAPSSDFRIRIYDKALEQGVDGHWVRVEMVLRGDHANGFVDQVVCGETVGHLAAGVLNDKLAFIVRDDSNITRCSVCCWWAAFVEELEKVRLVTRETVQHCVEHISSWLDWQVAPSMAIIIRTLGWPKLFEMAQAAKVRLNERQLALIQNYNTVTAALASRPI